MNNIIIDYDGKRGQFVIECPFYLIDKIRGIPNRRWHPNRKLWTAPGIRMNVMHIKDSLSGAMFSESARQYVDSYQPKKPIISNFPAWYKFKTEPRPYQLAGMHKTYGLRTTGLFMDMRTGKTKVEIDKHFAMRMENLIDRVLLVCPLSIRKNWVRELEKHAPFEADVFLLDASKPKVFTEWNLTKSDFKWLIVGVESLASGSAIEYCKKFLGVTTRSSCIVDESSKIKNYQANRTKACISLGRMAEYRTVMTGSPIANGPMDLFAQFEFLDPDILGVGDFYSFRNRYAIMGGYENKEIIGYQHLDELIEIISPFIYQVRQKDVLQIPDKIRLTREVQLNPEQVRLYKQMKRTKAVKTADRELTVQNTLEHMLRMQEITSGVVTYDNPDATSGKDKYTKHVIPGTNPKVKELIEITKEYVGPTIVWCVFRSELGMVAEALRKEYGDDQVVELHGGVDETDRDVNVNVKFQGLKSRFIVGNAATGGMGLTMDKAEVMVYMSNTHNFIDRYQSEERATGGDKTVGVAVIDIVAEGTVDGLICEALGEKKDVSEYVRGSIDNVHKRLFD